MAERVAYVEALRFLVRGEVETMPQAAFRWVLDNPDVSLVLSGARSVAELNDVIRVSETSSYSEDELAKAGALHTRDFEAA